MAKPIDPALGEGAPEMGPLGNIKLPSFWASDPQIWFAQVEAQFATRRIVSQQNKFSHVVSALQPEVAQEVRDLLLDPPGANPYDVLKEQLIRRMSESEQRRLQLLLTEEELGDRKPSQLLRKMRQLLGEHKLESGILKQLFVQRLPSNVQLILSTASTALTNEQLAELADRIMDVPMPAVQSAHAPAPPPATASPTPPVFESAIADLKAEITRLSRQVRALQGQLRDRSRSSGYRRGFSADRKKSNSNPRPTSNHDTDSSSASPEGEGSAPSTQLCWYHYKFGKRAHRCNPPCSFEQKSGPENA